jgi:hypothetical protein
MTLDNGERIVVFRLAGFISTVIYVLYIFLAYFPRIFRNSITLENLNILTAALTFAYLLFLFWPAIMKYRYVFFSADERGITLRWYKTGLIPGESMSIEIPAEKFAGYEITTSFLGLYCYVKLYQQVQGKRASYNPVSITALSKSQRKKMQEALNYYKSAV